MTRFSKRAKIFRERMIYLKKTLSTKNLVLTALLIAIGILIPMVFVGPPFKIVVGPYSATLMAHVPVFIAMFISPATAVLTAVGTTLGFFFTAPLVVATRAATHLIFALLGAYMIKKRWNAIFVCLLTGILHSVFESLVVWVFFSVGLSAPATGYSVPAMIYITAIGTFLHHIADFVIAYIVGIALHKAKAIPQLPKIW